MKSWLAAITMVAALCLTGLAAFAQQQGSSAQQSGDPVADAARKARQEKKDAQKPKKVYTDDDVAKSVPTPATSSNAGSAAGAQGTAGPKAKGDAKTEKDEKAEDPNGEAAWRRRFREQREKIAKAEKELDILQRESEKGQVQYYSDPQKAMTEQNSRKEINERQAKIDAKKQEIAQLKQQMDDMEDQLRKSGGDIGWAR